MPDIDPPLPRTPTKADSEEQPDCAEKVAGDRPTTAKGPSLTAAALARRFVAGHRAVAELQRQQDRQKGPRLAEAYADAMALLNAIAVLGPLPAALVELREKEDEVVRQRWAKLRAYYGR